MTPRLPAWLRAGRGSIDAAHSVKASLRSNGLHTVCEEARCPNAAECFGSGTAAFLILGDRCTRKCSFCAVSHGAPLPPDPDEPARLAAMAGSLALKHVVVTSVTRDDMRDGGAAHFARTVAALNDRLPGATVELLVPDFQGSADSLRIVLEAGPDVLNHNMETVKELYPAVRPQAVYSRSLGLLRETAAGKRKRAGKHDAVVKSGIMVGLGETRGQLAGCFRDMLDAGVESLTIGQYLRPRRENIPVSRYYTPEEFEELAAEAAALGFKSVFSGPLVRSSYHAGERLGCRTTRGEGDEKKV